MGLVITVALMVAWDRRRRGTYPSGRPPREFNETILRLMMGAATAGIGSFAVIARYEHEYAAIAARIRDRLK
jgi:hypothetical protein